MPISVIMCWKDFSPECGVLCALSKRCQKPCIFHTNYNQNMSLGSFSWIWCDGIFKWFFKSSVKSHRLYFWLLSTVSFQMRPQIPCLNKCVITLVAIRLTFPQCVLSSVSSNRLHESTLVALCPHCENILTSKGRGGRSWLTLKSHFTFYKQIPKNPGISC